MGRLGVLQLAQRGPQRAVDVRAAAGINPFDESQGRPAGLVVEPLQFRPERLDLAVVGDDVEQVALAEVVQHVLQRRLDLLDLLAAHAPRTVDDEHHRLLLPLVASGALISGLAKSRK